MIFHANHRGEGIGEGTGEGKGDVGTGRGRGCGVVTRLVLLLLQFLKFLAGQGLDSNLLQICRAAINAACLFLYYCCRYILLYHQ